MPENFNSLDPLGPQYGGNASIPTSQNKLPFEGDVLKDPQIITPAINRPEIKSIIPGKQILTNPAYSIKKIIREVQTIKNH